MLLLASCAPDGETPGASFGPSAGSPEVPEGSLPLPPPFEQRCDLTGHPEQVVPLLCGREVTVRDASSPRSAARRLPLGDSSDAVHVSFFGAVEAACDPDVGLAVSGCGPDGLRAAATALCRAELGEGLAMRGGHVGEEVGGATWYADPLDDDERASWWLYAVMQYREATGAAAYALDEQACADAANDRAELEDALSAAVTGLMGATEQARRSLLLAFLERYEVVENDAARVAATRGLEGSLLEMAKLYTPVPYGVFEPSEGGEEDGLRFPVLPVLRGPGVEAAATLLRELRVDVHSRQEGSTLGTAVLDALRRDHPLRFGHLQDDEAAPLLSGFNLDLEALEPAAAWLRAWARVAGAPRHTAASGRLAAMIGEFGDAGPGYMQAITTTAGSRSVADGREYAALGLDEALEYADRVVPGVAGERALGRLSACRSADRLELTLHVDAPDDYELWAGEAGVECARSGALGQFACSQSDFLYEGKGDTRRVDITASPSSASGTSARVYVTRLNPTVLSGHGREVVAAFPRDDFVVDGDCVDLALSAERGFDLGSLEASAALGRTPIPPDYDLIYDLQAHDPVPLGFSRTLADGYEVQLDQPLSRAHRAWTERERATCPPVSRELDEPMPCGESALAGVARAQCQAARLADRPDLPARVAAYAYTREALTIAANALDPGVCHGALHASDPLLSAIAEDIERLRSGYESLRVSLREERDPERSERALSGSRLAEARLLLTLPYRLFDPDDVRLRDALDDAYRRFPVVTRPVVSAEDAHAERLLRDSRLHPLLVADSVVDGQLDLAEYARAMRDGRLEDALRAALMTLDSARYGSAPDGRDFLHFLGLESSHLQSAALRLVQLAELRALPLLPEPEADGVVLARGSAVSDGGDPAQALYALSEGRARLSSHPHGYFHVLEYLRSALAAARAERGELTAGQLAAIDERLLALGTALDGAGTNVRHEGGTLEFTLSGEPGDYQDYELWLGDAGLQCARTGRVAGGECDESEFRLQTDQPGRLSVSRASLSGGNPTGDVWKRARIYLTHRSQVGSRRVIAAAMRDPEDPAPRTLTVPLSGSFERALRDLLAYRVRGEDCSTCQPHSVCETTRCEFGLCVRTPVADGAACGEGTCVGGACDVPGCGDGARSDGAEVPFEACDDGNLDDGDGCSSLCEVEVRESLESFFVEGWPAGPSPAVGVDGLGRSLLVWTADTPQLGDENEEIRIARLDPFGVAQGSERTLEAALPSSSAARPTVAGLRDGGWVVVYHSPVAEVGGGLVYRIIEASGDARPARPVSPSLAAQSEHRVSGVAGGFAVVWTERSGSQPASMVVARVFDSLGDPLQDTFVVEPASAGVRQSQPALAGSLDQWLVVWSEDEVGPGASLGVRARRFDAEGSPVDVASFEVAAGDASQPSASVDGAGDYVLAWTDREVDARGDVYVRAVPRFGSALFLPDARAVLASEDPESDPVVSGAVSGAVLVAYARGTAPSTHTALFAPSLDASSVALASEALANSDTRDVSAVPTRSGIWLVWSERVHGGRELHATLVPNGEPAPD